MQCDKGMTKDQLPLIYRRLRRAHGHLGWWPGDTRLEIIVGAILTQNTAWRNVEQAIEALKEGRMLSLRGLRRTDLGALERAVRPSRYFRQKARKLKAFIAYLDRTHGGSLAAMGRMPTDELRRQLLGVWGIGPETADSILLYAFDRPVFVVDAYTKRILVRHGWLEPSCTYEQMRAFFEAGLPADPALYNDFHAQIVIAGKDYCRPAPRCGECPLRALLPPRGPLPLA